MLHSMVWPFWRYDICTSISDSLERRTKRYKTLPALTLIMYTNLIGMNTIISTIYNNQKCSGHLPNTNAMANEFSTPPAKLILPASASRQSCRLGPAPWISSRPRLVGKRCWVSLSHSSTLGVLSRPAL